MLGWSCQFSHKVCLRTWLLCCSLKFYKPCGFSLLRCWKKCLVACDRVILWVMKKYWVLLIWVSVPDVFPQRSRSCENCVPLPLTGWFWCWMGSCSVKDKRKFSHLSTLHGTHDNNYFDLIFTRLASLSILQIGGSTAVFERNLGL